MRDTMKYKSTSLYYRLNPEHLEYLLSTEPSFPSTIGSVLNEIREKEFWHQLKYETICTLVDFLGKGKGDYSPTFIDSIFTNK
jgi:hypothetical protein